MVPMTTPSLKETQAPWCECYCPMFLYELLNIAFSKSVGWHHDVVGTRLASSTSSQLSTTSQAMGWTSVWASTFLLHSTSWHCSWSSEYTTAQRRSVWMCDISLDLICCWVFAIHAFYSIIASVPSLFLFPGSSLCLFLCVLCFISDSFHLCAASF